MYINHELEETEFFITKNSYVKFFFDVFYKENHMKNMTVQSLGRQIEINKKIKQDNIFYNIKLTYEDEPIKLRTLEIISDDETIKMGFFDHKLENDFNKKFFSMIDPYLN